ncbi:MAG: hypothetical protein R3A44_00175 [Caldilineaceae bacterium]
MYANHFPGAAFFAQSHGGAQGDEQRVAMGVEISARDAIVDDGKLRATRFASNHS